MKYALFGFLFAANGFAFEEMEDFHMQTEELVYVFAGEKHIKTYQSIVEGKVEDGCYVFKVKRRIKEREVRICTPYIVESVK